MRIDILSLFPDSLNGFLAQSIVRQAQKKKSLSLKIWNFREFALDRHATVDDTPYGGGAGMVLRVEPVVACLEAISREIGKEISSPDANIILTAADGDVYNQRLALELASLDHLVILCGHYKGFDERVSHFSHRKICVGDYVLSGGELPALVIVDSIARLLPGVVSDFDSINSDSHWDGLLGAPCYTRPEEFRGLKVPEVLLSGNHKAIEEFRFSEAYRRTAACRPELLEKKKLNKTQKKLLNKNGLIT